MDRLESVREFLREKNLNVKQDWLEQCLLYLESEMGPIPFKNSSNDTINGMILDQFLHADLNVMGTGSIQQDVHTLHNTFIKGPCLLQIDEVINIGVPIDRQSYLDEDEDKNNKSKGPKHKKSAQDTLKLSCTDGKQRVFAFEFKPVPQLSVDTPPGTKIIIKNVLVRRGLLMLVPASVQVLGGEVVELVEANRLKRQQIENRLSGKAPTIQPAPTTSSSPPSANARGASASMPPPRQRTAPSTSNNPAATSSPPSRRPFQQQQQQPQRTTTPATTVSTTPQAKASLRTTNAATPASSISNTSDVSLLLSDEDEAMRTPDSTMASSTNKKRNISTTSTISDVSFQSVESNNEDARGGTVLDFSDMAQHDEQEMGTKKEEQSLPKQRKLRHLVKLEDFADDDDYAGGINNNNNNNKIGLATNDSSSLFTSITNIPDTPGAIVTIRCITIGVVPPMRFEEDGYAVDVKVQDASGLAVVTLSNAVMERLTGGVTCPEFQEIMALDDEVPENSDRKNELVLSTQNALAALEGCMTVHVREPPLLPLVTEVREPDSEETRALLDQVRAQINNDINNTSYGSTDDYNKSFSEDMQ